MVVPSKDSLVKPDPEEVIAGPSSAPDEQASNGEMPIAPSWTVGVAPSASVMTTGNQIFPTNKDCRLLT